ncbi:ABC transporter ATP-binding protein [Wansuia hejianensis]|uniref:ABC transporter ATP-binding protein n=1 Tax=Wansuia hejianensis TaxID=2763667 RepID=A0A926ILQ8_9FIRM|nr:ABC transporter ATP-binding protein [Wansuia hejianensis]MBC8589635.1 ABC transporter ATP-binding protein [Wansuia hejianensis]
MRKSIKKAFPYLLLAFGVIVCSAILEGYLSIYMMKIVDSTIGGNKDLFKDQAKTLLIIAALLLPTSILSSYTLGLYKKKALVAIKGDYIKEVFDKNINEFQRDNNAKYLSAITNDMNTIEINYINGILEAGRNIIRFILAVAIIAFISPWALAIGLGISILSTLLAVFLGKPLQKHHNQRSELFEGYTSYIKEVLGAFHIIKSNDLSNKVYKDFYGKSKDIQEKGYLIDKIYTYFSAAENFLISTSFLGITAIVIYMSLIGKVTFGGVVLIVNNLEKLIFPIMEFVEWIPKIFSVKTIFIKLEDTLLNQGDYKETLELENFNNSIKIKDLSFSYEDNNVLNNISLELKKGEKYLIIGPSGGGKSTLLKLLRKYFNPNKGAIYIDDNNLMDITKESYFKNISNVEQQVFLFEDTLRNNITLYKEYTEEEINDVIDKSGLKEFVEGLPKGLDTMIYDNGKNISGGERSRVAIARGLLSKSNIIFLDEAFASLDTKVAKEIEETLLDLEDITVINVSHIIFEDTKEKYDGIFKIINSRVTII